MRWLSLFLFLKRSNFTFILAQLGISDNQFLLKSCRDGKWGLPSLEMNFYLPDYFFYNELVNDPQSREVREAPWVSFIRTWISFMRAPSNDLSKTPPSNTVTFRLKNFGGIQSIAQSYCENHKGTKHHPLPANMSDYCFITNYSFNHAFIFSPSR